jgi:CRP-like cAMP-binding protein
VVAIRVAPILETIRRHPAFALLALAASRRQIRVLVDQLQTMKCCSGAQRLAAFLLDLCPPAASSCVVLLPYEKVLVAGRLGMQPESLSRAFARLQAHGVHLERNAVAIEDVGRLRRLVDEDRAENWRRHA